LTSIAGGPVPRPVMADVARRAGVSHQTVSRVLNGHPNVSEATRAEVLAAIRDLGYRPNAAARTLVTGKTNVLGVISIDTTLYGPASMLYGIERALHPEYFVAVASLPAFDRDSLADAVDRFVGQAVAGIIVIAPETAAADALRGLAVSIPIVVVGSGDYAPLPSVSIDNRAGATRATQHLLDLGHRTVYHISAPDTWLDARERVAGWREALRAAGAPEPELMRGDWSARTGYWFGRELAARPEVTAVLCGNDAMALGFLRAAAERSRRVPQDISVVGFDDIPEAAYYWPPLTTVRQDFETLGVRALNTLMDLIVRGGPAPSASLAPDLIVRASSGPPPGGHTIAGHTVKEDTQ
jgi:DNA-binding LacI/PurR family transcriptional regulator